MKYQSLVELIKCAEQLFSDAEGAVDKKRVEAVDHYLRGLIHSLDGKLDDQLLAFEKAVHADPNDYTLQESLAELMEEKGRIKEAKEHYRIAADLRDAGACEKKDVCESIADLRLHANETVVKIHQKVVETKPNPRSYHRLGVALCYCGRLDEGIAAIKKSIAMRPNAIFGYYELAKALEKQGKQDEAKKYCQIFSDLVKPKTDAVEPEAAK